MAGRGGQVRRLELDLTGYHWRIAAPTRGAAHGQEPPFTAGRARRCKVRIGAL
jgi:hypothetical protein